MPELAQFGIEGWRRGAREMFVLFAPRRQSACAFNPQFTTTVSGTYLHVTQRESHFALKYLSTSLSCR